MRHLIVFSYTRFINIFNISAGLSLGEKCTYDGQCSVTNNASRCLYNKTEKSRFCSCVEGYIVSGFRCIAGKCKTVSV